MGMDEKLAIAQGLDSLGVDVIEAGSAMTSEGERLAIKKIADSGFKAEICSYVRALTADIDTALACDVDSVHLVVPVSDLHIQIKLKADRESVVRMAVDVTEYAKDHGLIVELSGEDASRADQDFLAGLYTAGIEAGADRLAFCDTVGVLVPEVAADIFSRLSRLEAPISIHCHNDYGLALANTLSAYDAGAEYITFTQNGIGERAGNAKYHELVMALVNLKKCGLNVDNSYIAELSKTVEEISGIFLSAIEPVVGFNAFRHESGIHVSGLLRDRKIYEQYRPEDIGRKNEYVLGKHTGTALVCKLLKELFPGDDFSREEMLEILKVVKARRMAVKKNDYAAMRRSLRAFYDKALGGVKISEFIRIVNSVKKQRT